MARKEPLSIFTSTGNGELIWAQSKVPTGEDLPWSLDEGGWASVLLMKDRDASILIFAMDANHAGVEIQVLSKAPIFEPFIEKELK